MYVQGVENVYDLKFNDRFRYGEVFLQAEQEFSAYNFERADTEILFRRFAEAEKECKALLKDGPPLALPAYDQCLKASHNFNLLDARGVISVTERASYIGRVRTLAKACCEAWLSSPKAPTPQSRPRCAPHSKIFIFSTFPLVGSRATCDSGAVAPERARSAAKQRACGRKGGALSAAPILANG
jgi:hypothetical protein